MIYGDRRRLTVDNTCDGPGKNFLSPEFGTKVL